jgi:drug/metabolite transporter (DMT)-like permease
LDTLLGFLFVLLWSSAATAAKVGIRDAEPLTLLDARFFLAGAILLAYLYAIKKNTPLPKGKEWGQLFVLAMCNSTGYLGLSWLAFKLVPAGLFGLFIATNPLIVALLSRAWLKRQIGRNEWWGMAVAGLGLCAAALPRLQGKEASPFGIALVVCAMLIYSFGSVYYKKAQVTLSGAVLNAWQVMIGALTVLPLAVLLNGPQLPRITPSLVGAMAWSVVPVSIVANLLWFYLLKKDPLRANMWLFLNPISGYAIAWAILGESMRPTDFVGLVLVMAGLLISGTIDLKSLRRGQNSKLPRTSSAS